MKDQVNFVEPKQFKPLTKEEILKKMEQLEVKADHYCRTDWERYNEVLAELKDLDSKLLAIYDSENIAWLEQQKQA